MRITKYPQSCLASDPGTFVTAADDLADQGHLDVDEPFAAARVEVPPTA